MPETFAQYLAKWLKQSTAQGLSNPLVKMPVKRFRLLQPSEFDSIADGGTLLIGTMSEPIARNLYRNSQMRIRERGEHSAFISCGAVEMTIASGVEQQPRTALFPVCLKRASLKLIGDKIKVEVDRNEDAPWTFNPVLNAHLRSFDIRTPATFADNPHKTTDWVKAQLGNRASRVTRETYVGLFSSQQMVFQKRLEEPPLRQALARNSVVQAKVEGSRVAAEDYSEITDDGLEELGLVLPCDDSQLKVIQLSDKGCCLQVEGPPGTGKSQTIANIISNALYQGRRALLVCDKKAAIVQVEERLSNCGLKPALLNLHDEDLDKREFLRQATDKFPSETHKSPASYPFAALQETRTTLNQRVKCGRLIAHPSLQVSKRDALAGFIQLRKELKEVPNVAIANWQSLSKDRLFKLLRSLGEWPELAEVLTDSENVWNKVRPEAFDENPNAINELELLAQQTLAELETLEKVQELVATVGIELRLESDLKVTDVLALVGTVLDKPACHPRIVGNTEFSREELGRLHSVWQKREELRAARHPVPLSLISPAEMEQEAHILLATEGATSWQDLSQRESRHAECQSGIEKSQARYLQFCDQIGLVYSPLLKVRRAQLQAVLRLGQIGGFVPRDWWNSAVNPVLLVSGWKGNLRACINHMKTAPLPLHFVALDRIAPTHWKHVEAMAEHGFNWVSYCLTFVNDRKCKFALRQAYPGIPHRGFKRWHEVTQHAVTAAAARKALRVAAEGHVVLKQLTENYLAAACEGTEEQFLNHDNVKQLENLSAIVERWRTHNDLFEVGSPHWQTFWEAPNRSLLLEIKALLSECDSLTLPHKQPDNIETAIGYYQQSRQRIRAFLDVCVKQEGDRNQSVLKAFEAQKEFAICQDRLAPLSKYLELQESDKSNPAWDWLQATIAWRDLFEKQCGQQKLDVDSPLWNTLRERLQPHRSAMEKTYIGLGRFFEDCLSGVGNYNSLKALLASILGGIPQCSLWLEKKRWWQKMSAFPEIKALWEKVLAGKVQADQAKRLFCFNLLRLCDPIAKPYGPELKQTLNLFAQQDDNLAAWITEHLKSRLNKWMQEATTKAMHNESELRRLSSLQRIRGTVRELVNEHLDYLLPAKRCWMMSPISLANLFDSAVFEKRGVPFDLVIFDEASQIRVLDGLLAMSFGSQVIIVGDKHQLPPTDFFASFAQEITEGDSDDFGTSESLLNEFEGVFEDDKTHIMLMSHYRSETPDLIRFSNDWFYDGKLEMFPPAHVTGIGQRLHYVPQANYSETAGLRNNPVEAKEVVKLIELHVKECPDKSLGVVAMNIPQMELIDEYLSLFTSDTLRQYCANESKFFLKNLETVQGDEMDRIILSLTYGKNPDGQFNAAVLGPLTKRGGERRLNVAITRSRSGITIVSSLKAADLATSGAQSRGFQCLKALLTNLENMEQARNYGITGCRFEKRKDGVSNIIYCDSPFEEQVAEFLENEGFEIECQYGAGNFRIDIVVKERGKNLLAIECDGAAYHSSLVARTRDRARQRILENLSWRFHRVWSTNWWFFEEQEKLAIRDAINAARSKNSGQQERASRTKSGKPR